MPTGVYFRTPEMRARKSLAMLGGTLSEEHKKKIGDAIRGRRHSPESISKMRIAKKGTGLGRTPWNKGIPWSYEVKIKLSGPRPNAKPWNKGRPWLEMRGQNHPLWKGGITPLWKIIRNSETYKAWRSDIFLRDSWTCQTCSARGCYIEAHHIIPFSVIMRRNKIDSIDKAKRCGELWDRKNGVTLCKSCHDLIPKRPLKPQA